MSKVNHLNKTMHLLSQALGSASQSGQDHTIHEAKSLMRQAMKKLESVAKDQNKKQHANLKNAETWWGEVVANVPMAQMSEQAAMRTLKELDAMIAKEKDKLNLLEKEVKTSTDNEVLNG